MKVKYLVAYIAPSANIGGTISTVAFDTLQRAKDAVARNVAANKGLYDGYVFELIEKACVPIPDIFWVKVER